MVDIKIEDKIVSKYEIEFFSEGYARVISNKTGLYGFIDSEGKEVIPCKYISVGSFYEGLAAVRDETGLTGYIDKYGKEVIKCQYKKAYHFHDGVAAVQNEKGLWGFINKVGEPIIKCQYIDITDFCEGFTVAQKADGSHVLIDKDGNEIILRDNNSDEKYEIDFYAGEGMVAVSVPCCDDSYKYGYMNTKGEKKIECIFSYADDFSEGLALVGIDGLYGFIDKSGAKKIDCQYNHANSFSEGMAAVQNEKGLWGFINKTGELVVPFKYDWVYSFKGGLAAVQNEKGLWGYIDKNGKEVIKCQYEKSSFGSRNFNGKFVFAKKGGLCGIIDKEGNTVVPFEYEYITLSEEGLVTAKDEKGIWYCIDLNKNKKTTLKKIHVSTITIGGETINISAKTHKKLDKKKKKVLENVILELKDKERKIGKKDKVKKIGRKK